MPEVSNDVLAEMIRGLAVKSDERHAENKVKLVEIVDQTTKTNGRLQIAESTIAQHTWAFAVIGAGSLVWLGVWLAKVL